MRLDLLAILIFSISGLAMAGLQANQHFLTPAMAPAMYNLGQIAGHPAACPALRHLRDGLWGHPGCAAAPGHPDPSPAALRLSLVAAAAAARSRCTQSPVPDGPAAALAMICLHFYFLAPRPLCLLLPGRRRLGAQQRLVHHAAARNADRHRHRHCAAAFALRIITLGIRQSFRQTVNRALRAMLALTLPAAAMLAVTVRPLVQVIFNFGPPKPRWSSGRHAPFLLGLTGHSWLEVAVRSWYASRTPACPLLGAVFQIVLFLILASPAFPGSGVAGLALADTLAFTSQAAAAAFPAGAPAPWPAARRAYPAARWSGRSVGAGWQPMPFRPCPSGLPAAWARRHPSGRPAQSAFHLARNQAPDSIIILGEPTCRPITLLPSCPITLFPNYLIIFLPYNSFPKGESFMQKFLRFRLLLPILVSLFGFPGAPQPWQNKVDDLVLNTAAEGQTEFLVMLAEQADLSQARQPANERRKRRLRLPAPDRDCRPRPKIALASPGRRRPARPPCSIPFLLGRQHDLGARQTPRSWRETLPAVWMSPTLRQPYALKCSRPSSSQLDPPEAPEAIEWNITKVQAPTVWAAGYTGQGAVVAGQGYRLRLGSPGAEQIPRLGWRRRTTITTGTMPSTQTCQARLQPLRFQQPGRLAMTTATARTRWAPWSAMMAGNQIGMAPGAKWIGCRNME